MRFWIWVNLLKKRTNKITWHRALAIRPIWRKLLSFCFFSEKKALNAKGSINEWEGWGTKRAQCNFRLRCADCDTTQLNHNFLAYTTTSLYRLVWESLQKTVQKEMNEWMNGVWCINLTKHSWVFLASPALHDTSRPPPSIHPSTVCPLFSCNHHSLSQLPCGEGRVAPWTGASWCQDVTPWQHTTIGIGTDAQLNDAVSLLAMWGKSFTMAVKLQSLRNQCYSLPPSGQRPLEMNLSFILQRCQDSITCATHPKHACPSERGL